MEELFDAKGAAKFLGVSGQRVRQFCAEGRIGTKVGSQWVFTRGELEAFKAIPRPSGQARVEGEVSE